MKSLVCVVSLVVCVCLAEDEFTDDKTENDIVVALKKEMADLIRQQDIQLSQTETALREEIKQQKEQYEDKIIQLTEHITTLKGDVDRRDVSVMFSAYLSTGHEYPGPGTIIPFDQVDLNVGEAFDNDTHTFVCPVNGMYFFTFSLQSDYMGVVYPYWSAGTLTVGGKVASSAASFYNDHPHPVNRQSSASVIANCNAGDEVLVKSTTAGVTVYGDSDYKESTFAGFLLTSL